MEPITLHLKSHNLNVRLKHSDYILMINIFTHVEKSSAPFKMSTHCTNSLIVNYGEVQKESAQPDTKIQ